MKNKKLKISSISLFMMFLYQIIKFFELLKYPNHLLVVFIIDTIIMLLVVNMLNFDFKLSDLLG